MKLDRVGNAKRNIFYGFINKVVTLLFPFVIRTTLIKEIGADFLGLGSLFASILQVLNLAELGFTSAIVYSMYKPIAEDDKQTLCAIINFLRKVYYIISIIILVAGLIVMPFIPRIIKGEIPAGINIYLLFFIYLISTSISYAFFSYKQTILTAYQRNDVLTNISTILYLFINTLQLVIIYKTRNFYLFVLTMLLSTLLYNFFAAIITNKIFPDLRPIGTPNKELKSDIKQKVSGLIIGKITGTSRNALDSIFISAFLGLIETAIYNNYYLIISTVTGFMLVIYSSIIAGVGNSVATETVEKNYNDLQIMNFIYMWLSGWFAICMLCLYQPFMELVFGKDMLFPMSTVIGFCCYFYVLKTGDILCLYMEANGLYWQYRYVTIAEANLNILLNFILGKYFGTLGIVSATTISLLLTTNSWGTFIVFKNYFKNQQLSEYFGSHLLYLVVAIGVGIITMIFCDFVSTNTIVSLLKKAVICTLVPNILFILVYFKSVQFKKAFQFVKNVVHL